MGCKHLEPIFGLQWTKNGMVVRSLLVCFGNAYHADGGGDGWLRRQKAGNIQRRNGIEQEKWPLVLCKCFQFSLHLIDICCAIIFLATWIGSMAPCRLSTQKSTHKSLINTSCYVILKCFFFSFFFFLFFSGWVNRGID